MHSEINKSGVRLELRGGLDTLNNLLQEEEKYPNSPLVPESGADDVRRSVSMSQLLQSRTF